MLSHFYCFLITAQGGSRLITDPPPPPPYPTTPLSFHPAFNHSLPLRRPKEQKKKKKRLRLEHSSLNQ